MRMKVLTLLGSPRKGGNSDTLARLIGKSIEEGGGTVEYVYLNGLNLRPCQGCGGCEKSGVCILKDDMGPIYDAVDQADRILLVSPVYFYGLSAQCKIFGDRMQAPWARKYLLKERFRQGEGRKGYLVSTAATKGPKIFDCSILTTKYIYDAVDVEYGGGFVVTGVDAKKAVLNLQNEMNRATQFGKDIVEGRV
ncbi:MAG: multimeric flavodoxin WrbA [Desulforhopalus sp.]|jgi:multimeric flavodoxin WrbA